MDDGVFLACSYTRKRKQMKEMFNAARQDKQVQANVAAANEMLLSSKKTDEYYFYVAPQEDDYDDEENDSTVISRFAFVKKSFWNKNHHLDDTNDRTLKSLLPANFHECMESHFECECTVEKGRAALLAIGFEEIKNPW